MRNILWVMILLLIVSCSKKSEQGDKLNETSNIIEIFESNPVVGYINENNLRIRSNPGTDTEVLGRINSGASVFVLDVTKQKYTANDTENFWYKITTEQNITGWVFGEYLSLLPSEEPSELADEKWQQHFGKLTPKEKISLNDLQSCSWEIAYPRQFVSLLSFSKDGYYIFRGVRWEGKSYGLYSLENNIIKLFPPLRVLDRFVSELTYSNEMHLNGSPVLRNDDEIAVFLANNAKKATIGETVRINQHYCERINEKTNITTNSLLYEFPDRLSINYFQDSYYGKRAMEAVVTKLAKTIIKNVAWYYIMIDFTSGNPTDGGGPFYYGWMPEEYLK